MFQFELWDMLQLMLSMGPSRAGVATDESPFIGFVDAEGNSHTPFVPISSTLITTGFTADVAPLVYLRLQLATMEVRPIHPPVKPLHKF